MAKMEEIQVPVRVTLDKSGLITTCKTCYALVETTDMDKHLNWHKKNIVVKRSAWNGDEMQPEHPDMH